MKKYNFLFLFILSFLFTSASQAAQIRLAVINASDNPELAEQSEIVANNFTSVLTKSEALTLVERDELELVLNEQKINASQLKNSDTVAKLGKILGIQYILLSSVVYEASPVISFRLEDAQTTEIIYSDTELSDTFDKSSIIAASSKLANKVLEVLAGEQAVITEVKTKEVIINRGSSSGVRKGDLYRVYTGNARRFTNIAVINVKNVYTDFSSAEIIKNGGNIKLIRRSDRIEAVSNEEAQSIVKSKKLMKKRPGESRNRKTSSTSATTKKYSSSRNNKNKIKSDAIKKGNNEYLATINKYADVLEKMSKEAKNDPDKLYEAATEWYNLASDMLRDFNDYDEAFKKVEFDNNDKAQKLHQQHKNDINKMVQSYYSKAVNLYEMSAKNGNISAYNPLAFMYREGIGVKQDYKKAFDFYSKAAQKGNHIAQYNVGYMYDYAIGVEQDHTKAAEWYSKSAKNGNEFAQTNLAYLYEKGRGVKGDIKKAIELYTEASEQGNSRAQALLGILYEEGRGVKQDYRKAFALYSKSAEQNNALGLSRLGELYYYGRGIPEDMNKAIELFRKAAALGSQLAKYRLERLQYYGIVTN